MASTLTVDNIVGATTAANVKLPAGHIVGWGSASAATSLQVSSGAFADIPGMSLSYACKHSDSIVYVIVNVHLFIPQQATAWQSAGIQILRDSSALYYDSGYGVGHYTDSANDRFMTNISVQAASAPGNTNAFTYKVQGKKFQGTGSADFNNSSYGGGGRIVVMEIAQ
jgi:hypothetical protein